MELILNIILIAALLVGGFALWQSRKIIFGGQEDETLTEQEADSLVRWLRVFQVASTVEIAAAIIRFVLSLFD